MGLFCISTLEISRDKKTLIPNPIPTVPNGLMHGGPVIREAERFTKKGVGVKSWSLTLLAIKVAVGGWSRR